METWVSVFLAIIALQTLLQAGFVVGLALGARKGGRALSEMEQRLTHDLTRHTAAAADACVRAAEAAEKAHEQAEKAGAVLSEADARVRGVIHRASGVVSRAASASPPYVESEDEPADEDDDAGDRAGFALPGRLGQAFALFKGARRAWAVWHEAANGSSREGRSSPN